MGMALLAMFAFTACGDDDDNKNDNNGNNGGGSGTGGENTEQAMKLVRGTWETVAVTPPGEQEFAVNSKDSTVWRWWNRYEFDADGNFNCWAVNYNGSGSLRGRIEHTMIGKYAYNADTKQVALTDVIEGYHAVLAYESGEMVENRMSFTATLVSISETEMVLDMTNQGYAKIRMRKVSGSDDTTSQLLGTWKTTSIIGSATEFSTGNFLESWNNYPTMEDAQDPNKESLNYMEFTFGQNNLFHLQQFDENSREFSIGMDAIWQMKGDSVCIFYEGELVKAVKIMSLTSNQLILHENRIDNDFKVHGQDNRVKAIYDETITMVRK